GWVGVAWWAGGLWALNAFFPSGGARPPALAALPPLKPATRASTITAPIAVPLTAIRDAMEQHAPRELSGRRDNPLSQLLGKADIGWTLTRGPFSVVGGPGGVGVSPALHGTLRETGPSDQPAGHRGWAARRTDGGGV